MKIRVQRSGGFAGLQAGTDVDTDSLPKEESQQLKELVDSSSFFELPPVIKSRNPMPDRFSYRITVESQGHEHTVEASEAELPEKLRPLVQRLDAMRRSKRR